MRQIKVDQFVAQFAARHVGPKTVLDVLLIQIELVNRRALSLARTTDTVLPEVHAFTEARALFAGTVLGPVAALHDHCARILLSRGRG